MDKLRPVYCHCLALFTLSEASPRPTGSRQRDRGGCLWWHFPLGYPLPSGPSGVPHFPTGKRNRRVFRVCASRRRVIGQIPNEGVRWQVPSEAVGTRTPQPHLCFSQIPKWPPQCTHSRAGEISAALLRMFVSGKRFGLYEAVICCAISDIRISGRRGWESLSPFPFR